MREISVSKIAEVIEKLCIDANYNLNDDIMIALIDSLKKEESEAGRSILSELVENAKVAKKSEIPMCQDTGMAVVFVDIGQEVHVTGGSLSQAINEGVRRGYGKGYLRKSVVEDPILRTNTGDNTPAVIHYNIIEGNYIRINVVPKGFGSENMSSLRMLKPSDGIDGIKEFVIDTVSKAGSNACPPLIIGVGIGGTMEKATYLSKKALLRPVNERSSFEHLKDLETELLEKINLLGIGPAGLGGMVTALAVNIETFPTHIAGLPVAVNISCHATRHKEAII